MSEQSPSSPIVENTVNEFFATFERAQNSASIDNVYGQPITYGDSIIVPVASVSQFFGIGLGVGNNQDTDAQNSGVGGGGTARTKARPVALAEIMPEGVDVHPVIDENRALTAGLLFAAWAVFWAARTLVKLFK
ncbi:MAG TPA: spore germination protein GerW family protein [Anaerolineae bacterium]|nr:spore germination protein GerW family protein [Anaerolineae bacterium]